MSYKNLKNTIEKILKGDIFTAAKVIRDIDDDVSETEELLKELYPYKSNVRIIGITGPPGVGKSTLVNKIISELRKKDQNIGVIAIDPSSPFSGGAILGDRIRMQKHSTDEKVFIRSLATRGHFGGLSSSTKKILVIMAAMGKDTIIIETVGVGQDEIDIVATANTTLVITSPIMGDEIQAIKAGIFEIGDIFVVNKIDLGNSANTIASLNTMLSMREKKNYQSNWDPSVIAVNALKGMGIKTLMKSIKNHEKHLNSNQKLILKQQNKKNIYKEIVEILKKKESDTLNNWIKNKQEYINNSINKIVNGLDNPYTVSEKILSNIFNDKK